MNELVSKSGRQIDCSRVIFVLLQAVDILFVITIVLRMLNLSTS